MQVTGVEFFPVGKIYDFINDKNFKINVGDYVIVETARGKEIGKVVYVDKDIGESNYEYKGIQALADKKILSEYASYQAKAQEEKPIIQDIANKQGLEIKISSVEYTIDKKKMIISFASEERVDFRDFVKELVSKYRVKIELKQIGLRDEMKIYGGLGICGRPCCCKNHQREFDKVTIKMAKNQNLSLNPTKISGVCGKLLCCLAYENDVYDELNQGVPKIGATVKTEDGIGIVVLTDIFKRTANVKIESEMGVKLQEYALCDIVEVINDKKVNK